jgi:hypothetical protein
MQLLALETINNKYPKNSGSRCTPMAHTWLIVYIQVLVCLVISFPSMYLLDTSDQHLFNGGRSSDLISIKPNDLPTQ